MPQHKQYNNPPILEALVDVQVEHGTVLSPDVLSKNPEPNIFTKSHQIQLHELHAQKSGPEVKTDRKQKYFGTSFQTPDKARKSWVLQYRQNGFTLSRLSPYEGWDQMRLMFDKTWIPFRSLAPEAKITRIGVRFINRLQFPDGESTELERYLRTMPELSGDLPTRRLSNFFMQLHLPHADDRVLAIMNMGTVPSEQENNVNIILDIDVVRLTELPDINHNLWEIIDELHDIENSIFEGSITRHLRDTFK